MVTEEEKVMGLQYGENAKEGKKETWKLQMELRRSNSVEEFMEENEDKLVTMSVAEYLNEMLTAYGLEKSDVAKRGGFAGNYPYQIFNGKKKASRDKLIQIAVGFPLTVEETQQLLLLGNYRELYVKNKRDAYIMFALEKKYDIMQLNDLLFNNKEQILE